VKQAVANMHANGGDLTAAIMNHSFEMGNLWGWTVAGGQDVNVYPNSNGTYTTSGCDGNYLFNSWNGDEGHTSYVKQTIRGIPNGLYELKADVTSFENRFVYVIGNGYNEKVGTSQGKGVFHEITLYFLVEDGTATIGAVGGKNNMPILLTQSNSIPTNTFNWLRDEELSNAYVIGGTGIVTDNVLNTLKNILKM
jgi:hypothetical protein